MGNTTPPPAENALDEIALYIYRYARRWAVGQSPNPEDAVIYDSCIVLLREHFGANTFGSTPTARSDRYIRYGAERVVTQAFTIPITVEDAVVTLHRYARRYTNGRGSFTAALVNSAAQELLRAGLSLDETEQLDGTIWAADGNDGAHDGLTPRQRTEALATLPSKSPDEELSVP